MSPVPVTVYFDNGLAVASERASPTPDRQRSPFADVEGDELNALLADAPQDVVALVGTESPPADADLEQAWEALQNQLEVAGVLLAPQQGRFAREWSRFPARLASLLGPLPSTTLVLRRPDLAFEATFLATNDPVWDWLIRTIAVGQTVLLQPVEGLEEPRLPSRDPIGALAPPPPDDDWQWLAAHLSEFRLEQCVPAIVSPADAVAVQAGLWQRHDFLSESHSESQSIEGEGRHRAGDHWHAIMHRREPDDSNAKYWYRRVGRSPIFPALVERVLKNFPSANWRQRLTDGQSWDAFAFVDLCATARNGADGELAQCAAAIQQWEMELLFAQSVQDAIG